MLGVFQGFGVIILVIALGYGLARWRVLDVSAQHALARLVFYVATPAQLYEILAHAQIGGDLGRAFAVGGGSALGVAAIYLVLARIVWRRSRAEATVGALTSCYVNAGNLGVPMAVYVLGNGSAIAPIMLLQLLVLAPLSFAVLDSSTGARSASLAGRIASPLRNPVTIASFIGFLVSISGWQPPGVLANTVTVLAGLAVPAGLIAYGLSLHLGPKAFTDGPRSEIATVTALKLVGQPALAVALGAGIFGMRGHDLLAVAICAGLPTAQNTFIYASRYGVSTILARDAIFATTALCVPALAGIAFLLA